MTRSARAPWIGLSIAVVLVAAALLVPAVTGWDVHVRSFPPLHADWMPRLGPGTVPAVVIAVLGCWQAPRLAESLPWRWLLLGSFVLGVAWMLALAFVDGPRGVSEILQTKYEYLQTARTTTDLHQTLQEYVARIPFSAGGRRWPPHLAGHPPGTLLFFVVLVRLGLDGGGFGAGLVVTLFAASTAPAVLVTARVLGAEQLARKAAPLLVLGTAAIWQCVSADGMFAAVLAWGIVALALAATRTGWRAALCWSVPAGLLLGYTVMLSYGLVMGGILALAVLALARSWRPLVPTALVAALVVLTFAGFGFRYWEALPVIHDRYWAGVARNRPPSYWLWGNLAALALSAGPVMYAGVAQVLGHPVRWWRERQTRVVAGLCMAGMAMVVAADVSMMSKGEVERIWLPFEPWLLLGTALLSLRWRRRGLVVQVLAALVIQHLLFTGW